MELSYYLTNLDVLVIIVENIATSLTSGWIWLVSRTPVRIR
jgi:hypothetical protein